jgi:predicted metal-dependent peptidase
MASAAASNIPNPKPSPQQLAKPNTATAPLDERNISERLSDCIVYEVSPRGGNNFWARLINGCDKVPSPGYGTLGVGISDNGRFVLLYDPEVVDKMSPRQLKLTLVHEAGHIALRHHERLFRILSTVQDKDLRTAIMAIFNIAADLSDNDAVVRHETEFKGSLDEKEWPWLLPELYNLPVGRSFEDYVLLIAKKAKPIAQKLRQALEQQNPQQGQSGQKSQKGQGKSSSGEGEPMEGDGSGDGDPQQGMQGQGQGGGKGKQKGPESFSDDPDDSISDDMQDLATNHPKLLEDMLHGFNKLMQNNHQEWLKKAESLTSDEAQSLGNKMKGHAKQLAKSAYEQTVKARGTLPGHVKGLVGPLLKDEQIPWHWFFQDCIQAQITSRFLEGMACPNVSFINLDYIEPWPGQVLDSEFSVVWITDTSGSMGDGEFARARAVLQSLMSVDKRIKLRDIQVDTHIQHEEEKDNCDTIELTNERHGYGGTTLVSAFRRALGTDKQDEWTPSAWASKCDEPPARADLIICYTDGYTEPMTMPEHHPGCAVIWLITPDGQPAEGMSSVPPEHIIKMFKLEPN